ncbi:MAG TPA: hypothetical protein ENF37_02065 [Beggiatoa sp.]|nr:hypothetical protein [Beggiatoa sp.]
MGNVFMLPTISCRVGNVFMLPTISCRVGNVFMLPTLIVYKYGFILNLMALRGMVGFKNPLPTLQERLFHA